MPRLELCTDKPTLARSAVNHFVTRAQGAIAARGRFTVALSGGSTPRAMFELLAQPEYASRVDWQAVHVFWGDERTVPPDHADSNYHMAKETLLDHVPLPDENIYRMRGEIEPQQAAPAYEMQLKTVFGDDALPRFDLIYLGMGDDGHTASLFPYTPAVHEQNHWVMAQYVDKLQSWRITLTPPVLNAGRCVIFLIAGADKAARLDEVLNGPHQPDALPAQIIEPTDGELIWLVDEAAAAQLT